jgi:hypothetical protein
MLELGQDFGIAQGRGAKLAPILKGAAFDDLVDGRNRDFVRCDMMVMHDYWPQAAIIAQLFELAKFS